MEFYELLFKLRPTWNVEYSRSIMCILTLAIEAKLIIIKSIPPILIMLSFSFASAGLSC